MKVLMLSIITFCRFRINFININDLTLQNPIKRKLLVLQYAHFELGWVNPGLLLDQFVLDQHDNADYGRISPKFRALKRVFKQ